jgi:PAS domain S-box-containing protein
MLWSPEFEINMGLSSQDPRCVFYSPHSRFQHVLAIRKANEPVIFGRRYFSPKQPGFFPGITFFIVFRGKKMCEKGREDMKKTECDECVRLKHELKECLESKRMIEAAFESAYEGIVITDSSGYILMLNDTYARFLQVDPREVTGKHVTEVIENTRMHIVARTGEPELNQVQRIRDDYMVVHRIPIIQDGKVAAVVGKVLFQDVNHLHDLSRRIIRLSKELDYYRKEYLKKMGVRYRLEDIVGTSPALVRVKELARKVARSDTTVFIGGESGTGKEMFAHAIHQMSPRRMGPFVKVNCAAIPESLLESILFGYAEGAFTGAAEGGRKGKFELAHGGTVFLDEIGELPPTMQAKLLRVLQDKEVEPVGADYPVRVDVRIIAASNRDLEQMVLENRFRADLWYRLNVVALTIPPLRERKEDLPLLVERLLEELCRELGAQVRELTPEAMQCLMTHYWPGNVRELRNVLERSLHLTDGHAIDAEHLPYYLSHSSAGPGNDLSLRSALERAEKEALQRALKAAGGGREQAAKLLGISRSGFYHKLKKYGLTVQNSGLPSKKL